jgi:uncharacterized protein (TIGR02679 family)
MPLWRALHRRLSGGRPVSAVRIGPLDAEQQEAIADLFGRARTPGAYVTVSVRQLDDLLRQSVGLGAREAVERIIGPLGDSAADRRRSTAEREGLWAWLEGHPVVTAQPALRDWVAGVRRGGLIDRSVSTTRTYLEEVLAVVAQLPAAGEPLPAFADRVLHDTHALDEDRRRAALVVRALAAIYGVPAPPDAAARRALWERAGIAGDELSSIVLLAGFRTSGSGVAADVLDACARAGHAAVLTLAQLRAAGGWADPPGDVRVFENPAMIALALRRFGDACPPLVCIAGWPSAAGGLVLQRLAAAGARLHYHGDFDGDGLRIAAHVVARTGAEPWRMRSEDYLVAASADGPPVGRVTSVPWDHELAGHLVRVGTTVPEERVAPVLLDDLAEAVEAVD